jgi:phosphoribosylformylglycinamidine synthase
MPTRKAVVKEKRSYAKVGGGKTSVVKTGGQFKERLLGALAHPNVASKHWIIRQYDHEVQGGSVIKPLIGPMQIGPSDASVVRPKLDSTKGVAVGCGMAPDVEDPYWMAIAAIDEAVRNVVCVGADPGKVAILDNFCWPSVADEVTMGTLVRACEACYDAAKAFGIPFVSGKDSLHNQFTNQETGEVIRIPNTLLISAMGVLDDVRKCVTMDLKERTHRVCLVSAKDVFDLKVLAGTHRKVAEAIAKGLIVSCHDVSDGGVAVAAAEMCIASGLGLIVGENVFVGDEAFEERPGRYLMELADVAHGEELRKILGGVADVTDLGLVQHLKKLTVTTEKERVVEIGIEEMTQAWRGTLDW